jgi:hypothetical protein
MFRLNNGPQQADSSFTGLGGGSYQVQVIDAQGCTATDSVQLSTPAPIQLFAHTDSLTCATSADGQILVDSLQNAAGTPEYRLNGGPYQLAGTFTGLTEGTYYLEVKDSSGCVRGDSLTVHAPDTLQLSNIAKQRPLCHADTNGQLIVQQTQGGTAPYGYSLDGAPFQNDSSFANLADGAYQLVVKDFYGCRDTANVQLNAPDSLVIQSLQKQAVSCAGAANGQITINSVTGGSGSYAYALDTSAAQPGNTFSGLAGASYMVTVQDTNGCSDTSTVTVPEPDSLQLVMWSKQDLSCYGQNSGQITADSVQGGTGSYAYALNGAPFQSNASFTGLSGGSYTLRVRDQNNCRDSVTVQVLEPDSISINLNAAGPACFGESSGSIAVSASGGKGAFRYSLNGNAFQPDSLFDSLGVGNYLVQVEDSAGCTQTRSLQLSQPQPLTVIAQGGTTPSGQAQGIATASAQGGTTPYSFSWDTAPVSTGDSIGGLAAGTYSVTVTDANGCEAEDTAIVDPLTDRPARSTPVPSLSLHPNPARDVLHLQFQGLDTRAPIQLRLIDAAGQTVLRRQVAPRKDATVQLPLRELAQGVYSLQVSSGSWQATRRVLIRR